MPHSIRILLGVAGVGSACSLLAPSDDSLLGGTLPSRDAATSRPDTGFEREVGLDTGASDSADVVDSEAESSETDAGEDGASVDSGPTVCATSSECAADGYCSRAGTCQPCRDILSVDLTQVEFEAAEPLTVVNASVGIEALRFPRIFDGGSKLIYERSFFGGGIWLTADFEKDGGAPLGSPIDGAGDEGAPLRLVGAGGVLSGYDFFFHRTAEHGSNQTELVGAKIDGAGMASEVSVLPAPFNAPGRIGRGLAVSRERAFWTVDLGGLNIQLWTTPLTGELIPARVPLLLANGCELIEFDHTPWVTPDGSLLLFTFSERTDACAAVAAQTTDVGVVRLNAAGQASTPVAVPDFNLPNVADGDGSLSPDLCWAYFASRRSGMDALRLFRSRRLH